MLALVVLAAKLLLLMAGLLVPGAAAMRALRLPGTLVTAFAGSAVTLYVTVLGLQLASVRISLASMTTALAALTLVALAAGLRRGSREGVVPTSTPPLREMFSGSPWPWALYGLFWFSVLWRAGHEPLAGPDIEFRWSFLSEQMLRIGSLDFYPPRSARDFLSYFWAESVPPGVSALHAWAYACAGATQPAWTIPAVVLQLVALHELLARTASNIAGAPAGKAAILATAACPLLTWSVLLGQETGLTALAAVGIVFALETWRRTQASGWAALAGVFAVLGASAREYGLIFPLLAAGGLLYVRANVRAWAAFAAVAAVALVWPLRTWMLTGNPLYSLPLDGLPANPRFVAWIEHDAAALGAPLFTLRGWIDIARYLLLFGLAGFAGWIVFIGGAARRRRDAATLLAAVLAISALWLASVRYTNGGLFYSLRVVSPALALGALALGVERTRGKTETPLVVALLLSLPFNLALPRNPFTTPLRDWPGVAPRSEPAPIDQTLALLLRTHATGTVLADAPGFQRRFLPEGVPVIPLWSPQADWLFDRSLPPAEALRRWRDSGVRHIIVTKYQTNLDFLNRHARWGQPPFRMQPIGETATTVVFAITARE